MIVLWIGFAEMGFSQKKILGCMLGARMQDALLIEGRWRSVPGKREDKWVKGWINLNR